MLPGGDAPFKTDSKGVFRNDASSSNPSPSSSSFLLNRSIDVPSPAESRVVREEGRQTARSFSTPAVSAPNGTEIYSLRQEIYSRQQEIYSREERLSSEVIHVPASSLMLSGEPSLLVFLESKFYDLQQLNSSETYYINKDDKLVEIRVTIPSVFDLVCKSIAAQPNTAPRGLYTRRDEPSTPTARHMERMGSNTSPSVPTPPTLHPQRPGSSQKGPNNNSTIQSSEAQSTGVSSMQNLPTAERTIRTQGYSAASLFSLADLELCYEAPAISQSAASAASTLDDTEANPYHYGSPNHAFSLPYLSEFSEDYAFNETRDSTSNF